MAAIALMRMHHYTGEASYRDKAEQTLETFAGVAEQFGIFGGSYGIAVVHLLESPVQVVVIGENGQDRNAAGLYHAALSRFAFPKTVLRFSADHVVAENLPPVLAQTLPHLPQLRSEKSFAVICSGASCQPPVSEVAELERAVDAALAVGAT